MTKAEMKEILVKKFRDEESSFTAKDIKISVSKNVTVISIKDYEACPFKITAEYDDYFGYCLYVYDVAYEEYIGMYDSKKDYPWRDALVNVAYHIAATF